MIKLIIKFVFPIFFLISSSAFAGLITTELAEDTYISYEGYDWTWASPVNVETYNNGSGLGTNTLEAPNAFGRDWLFIEGVDLLALFDELTVDMFKKTDGTLITSVLYWNSLYTEVDMDEANFNLKSSVWNVIPLDFFNQRDTFYVRNTPSQVPEPSTIMIFAIALIALSLRKRAVK
jgi:hypothetical protein